MSDYGATATANGAMPGYARSRTLDSAKFVLIALVPVCHLLEYGGAHSAPAETLYRWILLFNMPAFALVSGAVTTERSTAITRIVTTIVIPYLLFQLLYNVFHAWAFHTGTWLASPVTPYWLLWYLVSLACWRAVVPAFARLRWPLLVAFVIAIGAGTFNDVGYPMSLSRTLVFFPFFLFGYRLGPARIDAWCGRPRAGLAAGLVLLAAAVVMWRWRRLDPAWLYNAVSYAELRASVAQGVAVRTVVLLAALACSMAALVVSARVADRFAGWTTRAGPRCMAPYILHGFLIRAGVAFGGFAYVIAHVPHRRLLVPLWIIVGVAMAIVLSTARVSRIMAPLLDPRWLTRLLFRPAPQLQAPAPDTAEAKMPIRERMEEFKRLY